MSNDTGIFAPTSNMAIIFGAAQIAIKAKLGTQSIVVVHGPSGIGKTIAVRSARAKVNGIYLKIRKSDTQLSMLTRLAWRSGVLKPAKSSTGLVDQIIDALMISRRPLFVDEFDFCKDDDMICAIKDIYDEAEMPLILIGEEAIPARLAGIERFHNRIAATIAAQPVSIEDGRLLRNQYCEGVKIADDLIDFITEACGGCARRIVNNIGAVVRLSIEELEGAAVDRKTWGPRHLETGAVPSGRFQ